MFKIIVFFIISYKMWGSGGSENKVLSFNGFPSDPNKYKEDVISTRQFRLRIFNTSKADVNCYYKCVYGFKFVYRHAAPLGHIILIPSQPVFALSREATHTSCIVFGWPDRGSNPRSATLRTSTLIITPPMRFIRLASLN
jgi:hypothetical protein